MEPGSERELAESVAGASGPIRIVGGGTRGIGGSGAALSVRGLSGITLYEPGALTLVAQAGTPVAEIEAALAAENQRLAFEPMDHRAVMGTSGQPTIGGVIAGNISGPRRIQAGAARDFLLGVRYVDGMGQVIRNGGRVMKNVTGYDLVKLMAGSWGTLGVLSEVSLKVLPAVDHVAVLLIEGLDVAQAVEVMSLALGAPYDVTGAAHVPVGLDGEPVTMIRLEGFEESVRYRAGRLSEMLAGFGEVKVEADPVRTAAGWRWVRDAEMFQGSDGDLWRISVKPGDGPQIAARLGAARMLFDWGGGLIWAEATPGTDLRALVAPLAGHATRVRAQDPSDGIARFHPEPAPLAALSAGIRAKFDPRGIFNPGLMG